mgnify:CR=1 FL=1
MIYRLKELKGDTIAVPQLVFSKLGIAEEYNVRVALYVLATGITDPGQDLCRPQAAQPHQRRERLSSGQALACWSGTKRTLHRARNPAPPHP